MILERAAKSVDRTVRIELSVDENRLQMILPLSVLKLGKMRTDLTFIT